MMEIPMGFNAAWSDEPVVEDRVLPPLPPEDREKRPGTQTSIRMDDEVLAYFKDTYGTGWQKKMNELLLNLTSGLEGL